MAKKTVTPVAPRVTLKQKFENYREQARLFINSLRYPNKQVIFSINSYETTPSGKKPNAASVPELLAIVGTAQKLGKDVQVAISAENVLTFYFVDQPADVPLTLQF